ncbi:MAG: hypothetical protein V4850_35645 [Myxococcota bacterium]
MLLDFEQAAARFGHIDGTVVGMRLRYPASIEVDIRFYPWWEHPRYRDAITRGASWGFVETDGVMRTATLIGTELEILHLCGLSATDVAFSESCPRLWKTDTDRGDILVNTDVDLARLADALGERMGRSPGTPADVLAFVAEAAGGVLRAPRVIGSFPRQLHPLVLGALADIGVEVYAQEEYWEPRGRRLLAEFDDSWFIARDIWFDVPEFDHPPEVYVGA